MTRSRLLDCFAWFKYSARKNPSLDSVSAFTVLAKVLSGVLCLSIMLGCEIIDGARPDKPSFFIEVPFKGQCETETAWVQASVQVVTDEPEPKSVGLVQAKITLQWPDVYNPVEYTDARTPPDNVAVDDRVTVDFEVCGSTLPFVLIDIRGTEAIYAPGGKNQWLVNRPGFALPERPMPIADGTPESPDGIITGDQNEDPGVLWSGYGPTPLPANAGVFNGKTYLSRYFLKTRVTPLPDVSRISVDIPQIDCVRFDTDDDGEVETLGTATYVPMWRGDAPKDPDNFQGSAVVLFEGIDPNNEIYPAHWYRILNEFNPNIQSWDPQAGNWGPDIWIVEYQWGGADVKNCLIPAAKEILQQISAYYQPAYGRTVPTTVVGFSMGGVVARGALAQLDAQEGNTLTDLGIRALLTIDSPHQGAEVHFKTSTFLQQIHTGDFFKDQNVRTRVSDRAWLKLWNPAADQLLYERCGTNGGLGVPKINNRGEYEASVLDCLPGFRTTTLHDDFFGWLKSQGPSGSGGYPNSIPKYAVSLALGREPEPNSDSYLIGERVLWTFDSSIAWVLPDRVVSTDTSAGNEDDERWRARRNRKPGSRISIASIENQGGIFAPTISVKYNPTFISLNSAFDAPSENQELTCCFLAYASSPFDRVWYPTERPSCPSSGDMPCDGGSWFHDPEDVLANRHAMGVDDHVGEGQDLAFGFDLNGTDWKRSTIIEFVSMATNPTR